MRWALALLVAAPPPTLSEAALDGWGLIALDHPWRFRSGDDPAWARPDHDDSGWETSLSHLTYGEAFPGEWKGVAWLRTTIDVAPDMLGRQLAIWVRTHGASEIYLDGELIDRIGRIEAGVAVQPEPLFMFNGPPIILELERSGTHVLAIRHATQHMEMIERAGMFGGVRLLVGDYERSSIARGRWLLHFNGVHEFFIGASMVLVTLHLLIFLFMKRGLENLYFAMASLAVAGIALFSRVPEMTSTVGGAFRVLAIFKICLIATAPLTIAYYHQALIGHLPRAYWPIAGTITALVAASAFTIPIRWVYIAVCLALLEPVRVLVGAVRQKKPDVWIIVIGGGLSIASAIAQMLPLATGRATDEPSGIYLYGFLALQVSMSVYLARRFARMNADVEAQLVRVKALSELTLEQERKSKEEAIERERLEAENARNEVRLEEAARREEVLLALQEAHDSLKQTQAKLIQSEKMASLGQLVAGVAHEINTPVGAIHSMRDSLSKAVDKLEREIAASDPKILEVPAVAKTLGIIADGLRVIDSGSTRVAGIVKRLRTFARLDEAEVQLADLHAGLEDTLALLHHEIKKGIEVERRFGALPQVRCFPGQLNQVFLNILVNAIQAMDGRGKITLTTEPKGADVEIRIQDTGPGIAPEHLPRIFDPGFTTKGVGVGTGLGLSICYSIVRDHGGEIRAESELGKGATFIVRIPIER
jgi:signal transduction histidine kinase